MGKAWEHWLCWTGSREPGGGLAWRAEADTGRAESPALMLRKRRME